MTIGEDRILIKFNPSDDSLIGRIKQKTAELIDLCEEIPVPSGGMGNEQYRWVELAQTAYEEAAMWAVKAATLV